MAKWVCSVCGYVHEGDTPPERCPICKVPASKFNKMEEGEMVWASEHVVGVAKGAPEDIIQGLRENFEGECSEVGMYLAMSRQAFRHSVKAIRKSAIIIIALPSRKLSMLQSLLNFSARS